MGEDHRRSLEVYIQYKKPSGLYTGVNIRWGLKHTSLIDSVRESMERVESNIISFLQSGSP